MRPVIQKNEFQANFNLSAHLCKYLLLLLIGLTSCQTEGDIDCAELIPRNKYLLKSKGAMSFNIPIDYFPGERAKFYLNSSEDSLLVTTDSDWFYMIDLFNKVLSEKQKIGVSAVREMSNAVYVNNDSIFFFHDYPPMIFMMNHTGNVEYSRMMGDAPIKGWYKETDDGLYGFDTFYPQSTPILYKEQLTILLASEFYHFPDKNKIQFIGTFDLRTEQWEDVFATAPYIYQEDQVESLESHLFPFFARNQDKLLVSFPLSHSMQVFDLENKTVVLDSVLCANSPYIDEFNKMPELGTLTGQVGTDFFVEAPSYMSINFHEEKKLYSRVVRHKLQITDPGQLPSLCKRNYSLQLFDERLNFLDEIFFYQPIHQWASPIATKDGFILMKRCLTDESDSFMQFESFEIKLN